MYVATKKYEGLGAIYNSNILVWKTHTVFSRQTDVPHSQNQVDINA